MKFRQLVAAVSAAGLLGLSTVAGATLVIDNSASMNNAVSPFGSPNTATYGEAFHTNGTDTVLASFTMFLNANNGAGTLDFRGYIAAWDGNSATAILYASATQTVTGAGGAFTFTPNLALAPNTDYIAFLSISDLAAQAGNTFTMPIAFPGPDNDASTDGFFFMNNGTNFAALTSGADWETFGTGDVRLVARLEAAVAVPEPMGLALVGLALGAAGVSRRRLAKQA